MEQQIPAHAPRRAGRPPKGSRSPIGLKVPKTHKPVYEEMAARAGLPLIDYLALCLAEVHHLPRPDYLPDPSGPGASQPQLDLPMGA